MRLQLLKKSDLKQMPWKNGGGETAQVAIFPRESDLAKLDFAWRVSIASVRANGPFSLFPNYRRQLVVWQGDGLILNGEPKGIFQIHEFEGDQSVDAQLMNGPVQDIGVIFDSKKFESETKTGSLSEDAVATLPASGETFILCASGELRVGEFYLNPGDLVHASSHSELSITALERSTFVSIQIESRS
ncbi:MAG: HutD family protein [Proteobacteria bacterium]|nr:MAG: HutD family protein [Pseudomonadota bacterium]